MHAATHRDGAGTAITEPGASRVLYLARDVFVDGLGVGSDTLGLAIGAVRAALALAGIVLWRRSAWRRARSVALLVLPYVAWIAIGQNLRQQPRHALPVVVALAVALAVAASEGRRLHALGAALAVLVAVRTTLDATARRQVPPPGAQLAAFVSQCPDAGGVAVFAGPSARFFEPTALAGHAVSVVSLDDARLELTRLNDYPRRVLATDELEDVAGAHLPLVTTFCRPARIDRRAPCLHVYEWALTP